ncbi:MAG: phosphatidylserine decarboxylase [Clostridia bacterium]|nr:phosphatidylserine decarboxylase [Clostridia bacterium]
MIKDRSGNIIAQDSAQGGALDFLYGNAFGRLITKLLTRKFISKLGRIYMNSSLSKRRINKLIKSENIDMSQYENREFTSFNDFFTRKLAPDARIIDNAPESVISPADSKLTVYDIKEDSLYRVKGCDYSIKTLLGGDDELANEFLGGKCFVYRLSVDNYHRYCYPDGGIEESYRFIPGVYHTVNPIALLKYDVYGKNCRELTLLQTDNFGRVAYIEVGAMMVGKINNAHPKERFNRGDEKGFFSFGGSTIVMLYKKDTVVLDEDIAKNSAEEIETTVLFGESVGKRR